MNCSTFRKVMYLREDEAGADQWKEFQHHRATCTECSLEYRRLERSMEALARLGKIAPLPPAPVELANAVIGEIEQRTSAVGPTEVIAGYDGFIGWLGLGRVRIGIVSLLMLICATFAIEYTSGYLDIEGLENSMTSYSSAQSAGPAQLLDRNAATDLVSALSRIVVGEKSFFAVSGDWVMINKSSIEKFILLYNDLQAIAPSLPPEFRAAHHELWKLLTQRRNPKDLDAIIKERNSLIRELNDLIPPERKTP